MPSYCLNCKKNTKNIDQVVSKASNGRTMLLSKVSICGSKKKQESKGFLSNIGLKTPLSKIPILGDVLF